MLVFLCMYVCMRACMYVIQYAASNELEGEVFFRICAVLCTPSHAYGEIL